MRLLLLVSVSLLLAGPALHAQTAENFFNSGAQFYISNNLPAALEKVEGGLKIYPSDEKLKKLEELLKQQSQQNQQQQKQQQQQDQKNQNQQNQSQQQKPDDQKNQQQQNQQQQSSQKDSQTSRSWTNKNKTRPTRKKTSPKNKRRPEIARRQKGWREAGPTKC